MQRLLACLILLFAMGCAGSIGCAGYIQPIPKTPEEILSGKRRLHIEVPEQITALRPWKVRFIIEGEPYLLDGLHVLKVSVNEDSRAILFVPNHKRANELHMAPIIPIHEVQNIKVTIGIYKAKGFDIFGKLLHEPKPILFEGAIVKVIDRHSSST